MFIKRSELIQLNLKREKMLEKRHLFTLMTSALILLFTGCGTAIENLNVYQPEPIQKAELMPSQQALAGEKFKVVVMSVEDSGFKIAKSANLGRALTKMLENEIGRDQSIDILDRSVAEKFENEIKLDEMNGATSGENALLDSANYIVLGELKNASFTSRFVQRKTWIDSKGYTHVIPAHYNYTAEVDGQIKIYELPSMKIKKIIAFSDNKTRSEDSKFLGDRVRVDNGLINKAGEDAIHSARIELKNFLAPKGYLIGARSYDGNRIIKISLGLNNGIQEGDIVEIRTKKVVTNQLTEQTEEEIYKVADATVSDKIQRNTAWAHLNEEVPGEEIHLGDEVKVVYTKSVMDYVNDAGKLVNRMSK